MVMEIIQEELEILKAIDKGEIKQGSLSETVVDKDGNPAFFIVKELVEKGLVTTKPSTLSLGGQEIDKVTPEGKRVLKENT